MFLFTGTTSVRITERLQRDKRSDDKNTHHAELPVEFDLDLKVSGSNVTLHLHRNDNIPPAVPIFLKKNGNIFKLNLPAKKVFINGNSNYTRSLLLIVVDNLSFI